LIPTPQNTYGTEFLAAFEEALKLEREEELKKYEKDLAKHPIGPAQVRAVAFQY
jgi:hypothetical protein